MTSIIKRVYIKQTRDISNDNHPLVVSREKISKHQPYFNDVWLYTAFIGFKERGIDIIFFEDIKEISISPHYIIISNIDDTLKYFDTISKSDKFKFSEIPKPLNIPDSIKSYSMRDFKVMTMGEFKKDTTLPIFVKPYDKLKTFVGGTISREDSRKYFYNDIADEDLVLTSDVLDIISEYRCFVNRGKLIGIKHYNGDFKKMIDVDIVESAIKDYVSAPISYTIDFGLTSDNKTVLIECNDAWCICNYGLDADIYVRMLVDRWVEMFKLY